MTSPAALVLVMTSVSAAADPGAGMSAPVTAAAIEVTNSTSNIWRESILLRPKTLKAEVVLL